MECKFPAIAILVLLLANNYLIIESFSCPNEFITEEFSYVDFNCEDTYYSLIDDPEAINFDDYQPEAIRGLQKFAVICVEPSNDDTHRWTYSEINDMMNEIQQFYLNVSYGEILIDYDVYAFYDLGHNWNHYGTIDASSNLDVNNWRDVVWDAMVAADVHVNYDNYEYYIILLNHGWWRGVASIGKNVHIFSNEGFNTVAATLVGENARHNLTQVWGRIAHEIGHMFTMQHTHGSGTAGTKYYASFYSLMARGMPSALNYYSHNRNSKIGWFPKDTNMEIINPGDSDTFHVRPRHLDITSDTQALKVKITNSQYYMVEVVTQNGEDAWVPNEGVYIYLVDKNEPIDDHCLDIDVTPPLSLLECPLSIGDSLEDTVNSITITVDALNGDGYDISVINAADFKSDLHINNYGITPYESLDIWCDSPVNNYGVYRHVGGHGNPRGIGDEPLLNDPTNRLYARIHNFGDVAANDVTVTFYEQKPIGVDLTGSWSYIGETTISVPDGEYRTCWVNWHPQHSVSSSSNEIMSLNSIIKVVIEQDIYEVDTWNNEAIECINFFEIVPIKAQQLHAKAPGEFDPMIGTITVANPFSETTNFYFSIPQITQGWNISGEIIGNVIQFDPYEKKEFEYMVMPGSGITFKDTMEAQLIINYDEISEDDDFIGDLHVNTLGGITITATAQYQTELDISAAIQSSTQFSIDGTLNFLDDIPSGDMPVDPLNRTIYLKIYDEYNPELFYNATLIADENGEFEVLISVPQGFYKVNAYYAGQEYISSCASVSVMIDLDITSVWTSRGGFSIGYELYVVFGTIILIATSLTLFNKKYKK